jgi:chromosome segregation ATPase
MEECRSVLEAFEVKLKDLSKGVQSCTRDVQVCSEVASKSSRLVEPMRAQVNEIAAQLESHESTGTQHFVALVEDLRAELSSRLDSFSSHLSEVESKQAEESTDLSDLAVAVQAIEHIQATQQQQLSHRIEALSDQLQRHSERAAIQTQSVPLSTGPSNFEAITVESIDLLQQQVQTLAKQITHSEVLAPRVDLLEGAVKTMSHKMEAHPEVHEQLGRVGDRVTRLERSLADSSTLGTPGVAGADLVPKLMRVQNQVQQISVRLEEETQQQARLDGELKQLRNAQGDLTATKDSLEHIVAEVGSLKRAMAANANSSSGASGALLDASQKEGREMVRALEVKVQQLTYRIHLVEASYKAQEAVEDLRGKSARASSWCCLH